MFNLMITLIIIVLFMVLEFKFAILSFYRLLIKIKIPKIG